MFELEIQINFDLYLESMKPPTVIKPSVVAVSNSADICNKPHIDLLDNDLKNLALIKHIKNIAENFVLHNLIARRLYSPTNHNDTLDLFSQNITAPYIKYARVSNPAAVPVEEIRLLALGETHNYYGITLSLTTEGNLTTVVNSSGYDPNMYLVIIL